jgi:hypothetical protein
MRRIEIHAAVAAASIFGLINVRYLTSRGDLAAAHLRSIVQPQTSIWFALRKPRPTTSLDISQRPKDVECDIDRSGRSERIGHCD